MPEIAGALPLAEPFAQTWHVPLDEATPSVGEQLADALVTAGVSQLELARRLARDGKTESKRRWIIKLLGDEIERPNMAPVEAALSLPAGHFLIPSREEQHSRRVRLAELAERVARLEELVAAIAADLGDLASLPERVLALEQPARPKRRRAGR